MALTEATLRASKLGKARIGVTIPPTRLRTIAATTLAVPAQAGDEQIVVAGRMAHEPKDWHVVVGDGTPDAEYPHQLPDAEMTYDEPSDRTTILLMDALATAHPAGTPVAVTSGWAPENHGPDALVLEMPARGGYRRCHVMPVRAFVDAYSTAVALSHTALVAVNRVKMSAQQASLAAAKVAAGMPQKDAQAQAEAEVQHGPCCDRIFDRWKAEGLIDP